MATKMPQRERKMYTVEYAWVPTKEEMAMLERYSSVWTEEDWEARQFCTDFSNERYNAIQELVRARIHLDLNIYMIHDVDATFGAVYLAPVPGYKHRIKPTGLKDDPLAAKRGTAAKMAKPNKGANITQMLMDAKARCDAEQAAKAVAITAEHTKRCEAVRTMNRAILADAEKAWRQAGAPPTMAEKMRGIKEKPPQPSWEEWQKGIAYLPEPSRAQVIKEMELAPFLKRCENSWIMPPLPEEAKRLYAEQELAASKAPRAAGHFMPGTWQHWEVAVLEPFISHRMAMVPY